MKIEILDMEKLISVNKLEKVTSPRLSSSGNMLYDPEGILSSEIFGISKNDRRNTFAYIDLERPFLHPHIYANILKRLFRNIIYIVSGQKRYNIKNGIIIEDKEGWTGLSSLYDNWEKIDWQKSTSANKKALSVLIKAPKNMIFVDKIVVCPPAYRDIILAGMVDTSDYVNELNSIYPKIIRAVSLLKQGGLFARTQYATQLKIQDSLGEIAEYFKGQVSKKSGLIRRNLLGKTVDYGTRSVISAFNYNNETVGENMIDVDHCAIPISQCCSTFYPFIESWLRGFFTRDIINNPNLISFYDNDLKKEIQAVLKNPEVQFSEKNIKKMINDYIFNPNNRFRPIIVEAEYYQGKKIEIIHSYLILNGKAFLKSNIESKLNRVTTVTDLLYLACVDVCEKRHAMITRYPIGTDKGLFLNKIRVQSTSNHIRVIFNGKEYPYYPDIDLKIPHSQIGIQFIDTTVYNPAFLEGMGADFDGDTISIRGIWTDEANLEAEQIMNRKMTALNITGGNSRVVAKEVYQSFYELTKSQEHEKKISDADKQTYLDMSPDGFTRSFLIKMIADTVDSSQKNNTGKRKAKHNTWDTITIPANYFYQGHGVLNTTIGKFLFNKYILEGAGIIAQVKYVNSTINKNGLGKLDSLIATLLLEDKITRLQFNAYINRRDNMGFWLNGMLAHTISQKMLSPLKEVEKKKAELLKKYEKEISEHNIDTMNMIETQLIAYAREVLKDDPGIDMYDSGDLSFENNYKNNSIIKGPVLNKITNEFDFISTSFMDGIEIKDLPAHANGVLASQYPASIGTKDSGYMGKKLLALLQMMEVDEPGTDCGTKNLIPITILDSNKNIIVYTYIEEGGQLKLLTPENISSYVGKTVMARSPMTCLTGKICNKCAGELFYKLQAYKAGLFSTQLSHSMLNLSLKAKHNATVSLYNINPDTIISDI